MGSTSLPWLAQGILDLSMLAWLKQNHIQGDMLGVPVKEAQQWRTESFRPFAIDWMAVTVASVLALVAGRKRLPAPLILVLLMAAWLGVHELLIELRWREVVHVFFNWVPPTNRFVSVVLFQFFVFLPMFLLYSIPTFAALVGRDATSRSRWSWLGRVGIGLALTSFAAEIVARALVYSRGSPWPSYMDSILGALAAMLLATFLGVVLVRRFGPSWNRWLGLGYDGGSATTRPSEA